MTSIFRHIKSLFLPESIQHPFQFKKSIADTPAEVVPDNLKYVKNTGVAFVHQDTDRGFEADIWKGQVGQRSEELTNADMIIMKERRLKESKYRELKLLWSSDYSAAQAARELNHRKGFGQRTVEKYWSAMNSATTTLLNE